MRRSASLRNAGEDRSRRRYLGTVAALGGASLAGCLDLGGGSGDGDVQSRFQQVENPPDVVYVPSHRDGVESLGATTAGPYRLRPMISYAHSFSIVSGGTVEPVEVASDDDVHLMFAVEDAETGTVLPVGSGLSTTTRKDGRLIDDRSPWRMLSQTMGFHFGDNVLLDGDGTYEVTVSLPALDLRRTGALSGRFESSQVATVSFEYDQALRDRLIERIRYTDDADRGVPGAISPMDGAGSLPDAEELPGTLQGGSGPDGQQVPRSHDANVPVAVVEDFLGDGNPYLLVSPRTPYNRFPLVGTAIDVTVRDGSAEGEALEPTVDDEVGFHYGSAIPELEPGNDVVLSFTATPNVARHQGYETAFLEMDPIEFTVEAW